jgi:arylsulfatase A-like enzyme
MGVGGVMGGVVATLAVALKGGSVGSTGKFVPYAPRPLPTPVPSKTTPVDRPNFLLVIADDLGQDQVGAYHVHPTPPPTPNIDALASHGLLFRNMIANPVCSPTRGTLMTGRYAYRYGIGNAIPPRKGWGLPATEEVVAATLREASGGSYLSAMVGKWHLATPDMGGLDHARSVGFTHHYGTWGNLLGPVPGTNAPMTYNHWAYVRDGELSTSTSYISVTTTDDAVRFAQELPEPWFIVVGYHLTHYPMHLPPEGTFTQPVPPSPNETQLYRFMVEALDHEFGRLLDGIGDDRLGRTDVVFMGDNGTAPVGVTPPFDKQMSKGALTRGGITVPFVMSGPSVRVVGESDTLLNTTDLYATWLDLAHLDASAAPRPADSVSFAPVLSDPTLDTRRYAYSERFAPNGMGPWEEHVASIQDEHFKLIVNTGKVEAFYDLRSDPGELDNLVLDRQPTPEYAAALMRLKYALPDVVSVPERPSAADLAARGLPAGGKL